VVHFYRNVFSHVPKGKVADVARMLKAIHAQEDEVLSNVVYGRRNQAAALRCCMI
jgi:uncharacterized protein YbaA (DUF1428 family)